MLSRSIVISLAIAIATIKSPTSGFTIPRAQSILDITPDLEPGQSKQLEVKYDLKTSNDHKKREGPDATVIAINNPKKIEENNNNNETYSTNKFPTDETTGAPTKSFTTSAPSTTQTTITREPEKAYDTSPNSTIQTPIPTESQIQENSNPIKQDNVNKEIKQNEAVSSTQNIYKSTNLPSTPYYQGEISSTEKQDTHNTLNTFDNSDMGKLDNNLNDVNLNSTTNSHTQFIDQSSTMDTRKETGVTDQIADQTNTKKEGFMANSDEWLEAPTTPSQPSESKTDITNGTTRAISTTDITTNLFTTETLTTDFYPPTLPIWKKYTTIDRMQTSTEDTTAPDIDMARAETAQTRISLEKVFTNPPIPLFETNRNDFTFAQEPSSEKLQTTSGSETTVSVFVTSPSKTSETEVTKSELVSMRAGYKDNRETTYPHLEEAVTTESILKMSINNTEMFSSGDEAEPSEVEVPDNKNDTVYESQSQLAEDAIKEELLKEETINDNEENAKRYHDDRITYQRDKTLQQGMSDSTVTVSDTVTEDMLSVKPIGHEKKKSSILYAVSPNYKPPKRIEVQSPKPFVRDPDDNSWRNESISSLGIVFKPKNASKSFTEVLKNKTETELSNMSDKDNKGDVPDLRVRLEKIAEVRKSKKKVNKFGDTIYSDYEESGENANAAKEETTSPMNPPIESIFNFTPPPQTKSSATKFDLTANTISKEPFDLFKNEGTTSPLTTNKAKKFHAAEYYDATDEYDADYVNQHKIDLKKFTKSLKSKETPATHPPELLRTKPMSEFHPERKATLQYFPPTQKVNPKVNLNDYDTSFDRKVNMYSINKATINKSRPPVPFGTVVPTQTTKYEPVKQVSAKPVYTPVYQADNLDKNLYLTNQPRMSETLSGNAPQDGDFNRASYVIKHYRDFINEAVQEGDDERSEYPYTESPIRGITMHDPTKIRDNNQGDEDYDYDVKYRKDIMNRFVDNFNQNSERFKVDFPVLYNSSIVHRPGGMPQTGKVASSTAFIKRLYETGSLKPSSFVSHRKPCEPNCDNMTVELSPAYELHYYVPDQEEKEEMEPRSFTIPHRYRL